MCFDNYTYICVRQSVTSVAHHPRTSTSQWSCHNCRCGAFPTVLPMHWDYSKPGSLKYCMTV